MTLFRGFFKTFHGSLPRDFRKPSGALPHSQKVGRTPYHWRERLGRKPISTPKQQGQLSSRRANSHSKKEWGPLKRARKKRQLTTSRRKGQFEGRAKTHTKKTGPIPTRRMTGQPQPRKGRAKHQPREGRANPFREGKNNLHSEGQVQEGLSSAAQRRHGEPPPQQGRANSRGPDPST